MTTKCFAQGVYAIKLAKPSLTCISFNLTQSYCPRSKGSPWVTTTALPPTATLGCSTLEGLHQGKTSTSVYPPSKPWGVFEQSYIFAQFNQFIGKNFLFKQLSFYVSVIKELQNWENNQIFVVMLLWIAYSFGIFEVSRLWSINSLLANKCNMVNKGDCYELLYMFKTFRIITLENRTNFRRLTIRRFGRELQYDLIPKSNSICKDICWAYQFLIIRFYNGVDIMSFNCSGNKPK